ncbi:MAG: hypothetical protein HUJ42_03190 [Malacoplasma sp.]|mgnify:FL=1|nr:hypothetical protein [Malacoplasma sp.]
MKRKSFKKLILSTFLGALAIIPIASFSTSNSIVSNSNKIQKSNSNLNAIADTAASGTGGTQQSSAKTLEIQLNKNYKDLDWYGKEFSNAVTESQLKQLLIPNLSFDVNWGISILSPTDGSDELTNGYVNFLVYQIKTNFKDGVPTPDTSASSTSQQGQTSTTNQIDGRTLIEAPTTIKYSDSQETSIPSISMQAYPSGTSSTGAGAGAQQGTGTTTTTNGNVTINDKSVESKYVWTTKNITGLFLPYKYNFEWNSNDQIGDFLRNETSSSLTAQDVYDNMISKANSTDILPSDTESKLSSIITVSQNDLTSKYGISSTDASQYGVQLVTVDFTKSDDGKQDTKWASGKVPNVTYLVRGLGSNKSVMDFNTTSNSNEFLNTTFSISAIKKQNPNFNAPSTASGDTVKVSDFTPSQLINALTTAANGTGGIYSLLAQRTYLSNTSGNPALYLTYMGSNAYKTNTNATASTTPSSGSTSSDTRGIGWAGTGLYEAGNVNTSKNGVIDTTNTVNPATSSRIISISADADDATGTLYLKVTYNVYDVFENVEKLNEVKSITIYGLQADTNSTANGLYLSWKSVDELLYSNANDVINLYNTNKDDANYLKALSNTFLNASPLAANLDRTVSMKTSGNSLTIDLTFPNYGSISNFTYSNTYTLSGSSDSASGVTFKSQSSVASSIANYANYSPTALIDAISSGQVSLSSFYSANGANSSTLVLENDTSDGIIIQVSVGTGTSVSKHSAVFTGLKSGVNANYVYNFAFADNSTTTTLDTGIASLKKIPIDQITLQDVFDLYVKNLSIFNGDNGFTPSINDVAITKDTKNNTINVQIVVPSYNQSKNVAAADKTFSTTLNGFMSVNQNNDNSSPKILDLTLPLSITFALVIVAIMLGILINLIVKRKKLAKSNTNLKEIRAQNKRQRK